LIEFKSVTAVCRGQLYQKVEAGFDWRGSSPWISRKWPCAQSYIIWSKQISRAMNA